MERHSAYGLALGELDIVAIDDSRTGLSILRSLLGSLGVARLRPYSDGPAALRDVAADPPNLLVTDWQMAPLDGCGLIRAIRRHHRPAVHRLPVLLVTAYATRPLVEAALKAGANQILAKPVSLLGLQRRIEWLLRDSRRMLRSGGCTVVEGVDEMLDALRRGRQPGPAGAVPHPAAPPRPSGAAPAPVSRRVPSPGSVWEI